MEDEKDELETVLASLAAVQAEEVRIRTDLETRHQNEKKMSLVRDWIDILMIVLGLVITAALIWAKLDRWAPETGPLPIAGVAVRRVLGI